MDPHDAPGTTEGPEHWRRVGRRLLRLRGSERGLTLIELLLVIAVIGILASIAFVLYYDYSYQAQVARAVADIASISSEIKTFEAMNLRLPTSLAEINRATFKDSWGNPYGYLDIENGGGKPRRDGKLKPINSDFDLYSMGRDGDFKEKLDAKESLDDIVRAFDGQFIGLAEKFVPW